MEEENKITLEDLPPMSKEEKEFWEEHNDEYYHYLYRIDNKLNGKFYYGIHSEKKDNELGSDGYMGSGVDLVKDQKKDGIENFEKTIIKTFSTRDEARLEEFIIVNEELVKDPNCYNKVVGGGVMFITSDLVVVNYKDRSLRKDKFFLVTTEEYQNNKDKYITPSSNKIIVKYRDNSLYIDNKFFKVDIDEYYKNRDKYITVFSGKGIYKNILDDKDIRILNTDNPLVLLGQFVGVSKGIKRNKEFKQKIAGKNNGRYGSMWITNGKENKVIKKDIKIPEGWWKGRIIKIKIDQTKI